MMMSLSAGHGCGDLAYQYKGFVHIETIEIRGLKHVV
jgi:hypothetical protein